MLSKTKDNPYSIQYSLNKVAQTDSIWASSINSSTPIFFIMTQLFMSNYSLSIFLIKHLKQFFVIFDSHHKFDRKV